MRKSIHKITAKLRTRIAQDEERLESLRHGSEDTHVMLAAAQSLADESRLAFEKLRMPRMK